MAKQINLAKFNYEQVAWDAGYKRVAGVDEAGRGPLAGPVVAAACILDPGWVIDEINDSKQLSAKRRDDLFLQIQDRAIAWSIVFSSVDEIETLNILGATKLAMLTAIQNLRPEADTVLIDAVKLPDCPVPHEAIVKGDSLSASIAAASILAKVARDRHMIKLAEQYPQYGFEKHKGYGTAAHYEALNLYGPCPEHRELFLRSWRSTLREDKQSLG